MSVKSNENSCCLFNIQRFSLHDGPGIRTTVFFKGCNMRCAWCHNPESFKIEPQLSYNADLCIGCGACEEVCASAAHRLSLSEQGERVHIFDRNCCRGCFKCADVCKANSLTVIGRRYSLDEIIALCIRDRRFYSQGGGVTFSGGEATMQLDPLFSLASAFTEAGIHTCLETNGALSTEKLKKLAEVIDLFLLDFKLYDNELHKKYVGMSNDVVYTSIKVLNMLGKPVILRCPIITGINDMQEHFDAINKIKNENKNIIAVEIMPYHSIGASKWKTLGMDYTISDDIDVSNERIKEWNNRIGK